MPLKWIEIDGHAVPAESQGMDTLAWAAWLEAADRRVGETERIGDWRVSSVFLGIDHNFGPPGAPPLLYETMVFEGDSWRDGACFRYRTREAAEEGHRTICETLRAGASIEAIRELDLKP